MRANDYLPEGPNDGINVLVRLTAVDQNAIKLIRLHLMTLPWQPFIGCRTNCIRFALRRTVATLAEEYSRRTKRKQRNHKATHSGETKHRRKHEKGN